MGMSEAVVAEGIDARRAARAALGASGVLWFIPAAIGQWIFAYYIAVQYGATAFSGNLAAWNDVMVNGIIPGDLFGNIALMIHMAIAFVITIGGTLQLMPFVRNRAPTFHRWNGRVYIVIALLTSVAALYMTWTRDQIGTMSSHIAISINAVLIMVFALMAWRTAMARRFDVHQRWAMRTFMVVSGVWFLRVLYGMSIMLAQGRPPGVGENMDGPTDLVFSFASYLLPLALLELYFRAKRSTSPVAQFATAGIVTLAAGATALGVVGAMMVFWLPRVSG
jgi:hypothetical protein